MNILLKLVIVVTFIAFTIIKAANFNLDPGNFGWILFFIVFAFIYNSFNRGIEKSTQIIGARVFTLQ